MFRNTPIKLAQIWVTIQSNFCMIQIVTICQANALNQASEKAIPLAISIPIPKISLFFAIERDSKGY
jgi:hypothetical protein